MANNTYPDNPGPYRMSGSFPVFSDKAATLPISVFDTNGNPLPNNRITVGSTGIIAPFQAVAVGTGIVYTKGDDGVPIPLYPATSQTAPTVTGSKGANAALTSLMAALVQQGIVVDSTS